MSVFEIRCDKWSRVFFESHRSYSCGYLFSCHILVSVQKEIYDKECCCKRHEIVVETRVEEVHKPIDAVIELVDAISVTELELDVFGSKVRFAFEQDHFRLELVFGNLGKCILASGCLPCE